jgi:formylglycine-generating enzyme required for sulfatase activity
MSFSLDFLKIILLTSRARCAREEAFKRAMASDDPAVLKTFLQAYPKGVQTDEVRGRPRRLEPGPAWQPSRRGLVTACVLGVVVGSAVVWLAGTRRTPVSLETPPVQSPTASPAPVPGSGQSFFDRLANGQPCPMCPEMVVAPAGRFTMGSPASEPERTNGEVQVSVTIARPFAVGKFAVTFSEWDACVADGGCKGYRPDDRRWGRDRRPVINVNSDDAKLYID